MDIEVEHVVWAVRRQVLVSLASGGLQLARRTAGASRRQRVAVVPVQGILTPRGSPLLEAFGATPGGLEGFRTMLQAAAADDEVDAIILDVDSPGGMVDGVPETAALIREARARKPVVAIANTEASSAAYWLASQASRVLAAPSAMVGSIGVYAAHVSRKRAMENNGFDVTLVSAGERKTELHPDVELSESGREQLQALVDDAYGQFVADVARGRGVSEETVRTRYGQGAVFTARRARELGLVDGIATLEEAVVGAASLVRSAEAEEPEILAEGEPALVAGAIPAHDTEVVDEPWDAGREVGAIPDDAGARVLRRMYAWVDPEADPDTKAAYKLPHHKVTDGRPGPANVRGVRAALSVLGGARGGVDIPERDRAAVQRHLRRHLEAWRRQQGAESLSLADELALAACAVGGVTAMARLRAGRLSDEQRELLELIKASVSELPEVRDPEADVELRRVVAQALRHIAAV